MTDDAPFTALWSLVPDGPHWDPTLCSVARELIAGLDESVRRCRLDSASISAVVVIQGHQDITTGVTQLAYLRLRIEF